MIILICITLLTIILVLLGIILVAFHPPHIDSYFLIGWLAVVLLTMVVLSANYLFIHRHEPLVPADPSPSPSHPTNGNPWRNP